VLNIEPHDIHRNVMFVKLGVYRINIRLVSVVPSALVVAQREHGRQRLGA
jgi:hypothetical protein